MKKYMLLIIALCLLLCACGAGPEYGEGELRAVPRLALPDMSREESLRMFRFMSGGRAELEGGRLYCPDFDAELKSCLGSYSLSPQAGDFRVLAGGLAPAYINEYGGRLYFIDLLSGALMSLSTEGGEPELLYKGPCDFLSLSGDLLYFCDERMRLCQMSPESSELRIILPEACCYPFVSGGCLIYQRAADEHLHMLEMQSGEDTELTDIPAYAPVIWDGRLYCTVEGGIFSMDLQGLDCFKFTLEGIQGAAEYCLREGGLIIRGAIEHGGLRDFEFSADRPQESFAVLETGIYSRLEYAGEDMNLFSVYEAGGRARGLVLERDGERLKLFSGSAEP